MEARIGPTWSKIEAKSLPGGVQMASKAVFNKAAISVPIFERPQGGGRGPKWRLKLIQKPSFSAKIAERVRGSKIEPKLVQNRGQKPPRRRPDGFERHLQ